MKKWVFVAAGGVALLTFVLVAWLNQDSGEIISPLVSLTQKAPEPVTGEYAALTFEALSQRRFPKGEIKLGAVIRQETNYTSYVFTYQSDGKTISGMANIPKENLSAGRRKPFPVIILLRGYADKEVYHVGYGTEKSANFLAENGFLTLAPDFLGYGYSDWEDQDILVARFYRPVEVLNLISSVDSLPSADSSRIGLWAHSNGGQIALSVLEITGKSYPTSLWAPVSLGFPESVLVYLGREETNNPVKKKIDQFRQKNDPKLYSISEYWDKIYAPFIIHQGTADEMIQAQWTRDLVNNLKKRMCEVNYYEYPGENHNFNRYPKTGETLRNRDLKFFTEKLKK